MRIPGLWAKVEEGLSCAELESVPVVVAVAVVVVVVVVASFWRRAEPAL